MQPSHSPLPFQGMAMTFFCLLLLILQLILLAAHRTPSPNISMVISLFCSEALPWSLLPVNKTRSGHLKAPKIHTHSTLPSPFFPTVPPRLLDCPCQLHPKPTHHLLRGHHGPLCDQENSAHLQTLPVWQLRCSWWPPCIYGPSQSQTPQLCEPPTYVQPVLPCTMVIAELLFFSTVREWDSCEQGSHMIPDGFLRSACLPLGKVVFQ